MYFYHYILLLLQVLWALRDNNQPNHLLEIVEDWNNPNAITYTTWSSEDTTIEQSLENHMIYQPNFIHCSISENNTNFPHFMYKEKYYLTSIPNFWSWMRSVYSEPDKLRFILYFLRNAEAMEGDLRKSHHGEQGDTTKVISWGINPYKSSNFSQSRQLARAAQWVQEEVQVEITIASHLESLRNTSNILSQNKIIT
ncbi:hypothetical protein DFJ63DRAFT_101682 [Scheffersomyces coipomensis]|uniref:uncharacterized protein n=1 Tax=Scheffersomyces coipomensis TaxID=1788519 RepID=UPI00315C946B